MTHPVAIVGAGPGHPGLLTLRAAELLGRADFVLHDRLVPVRLLEHVPTACRVVSVEDLPGEHCHKGPAIIDLLIEEARLGRRVVRLHGGDPFVFGRGGEEAEALRQAGLDYEVVPGVSSGLAAPAFAGVPLTHRDHASAVAFVTGHEHPGKEGSRLDWEALARFPGTLVVFMGLTRLEDIVRRLKDHGKEGQTPVAAIHWGSLGVQRTVTGTLDSLPGLVKEARLGSPTLLVVGEVAAFREKLAWFERRPLFGKCVLVTRPRHQAGEFVRQLEDIGATCLVWPAVEVSEPLDWAPVDRAIERLKTFQWLVFTSANGVHFFVRRLRQLGRDLRSLGHLKLAAIGPSTADALRAYHLESDVVPDEFRSEALVESLRDRVAGTRVLLARADRGRELLKDELGTVAKVEQVAVYRQWDAETMPANVAEALRSGAVDYVTLTSSNIAHSLARVIDEPTRERILSGALKVVTISPVTSAAVRELGWPVAGEAAEYTTSGVAVALAGVAELVRVQTSELSRVQLRND